MTIITGQIETLKTLKSQLKINGIDRFNSVADINNFLRGFSYEKSLIPQEIKESLDTEVKALEDSLKFYKEKRKKSFFFKVIYYFKVKTTQNNLLYIRENFEKISLRKCDKRYEELDFIKQVVDELYNIIAGVIGENAVVNELKKLSDDYYLINDFSVHFKQPLFYQQENTRIYNIQVDHLLVSKSGVFQIETKNWSRYSVENRDLNSPVKQALRASYALFVLLNNILDIKVSDHHWGNKRIPVRNIIVLFNHKPRDSFKLIKIVSLNELNSYINYFDEIFNKEDTKAIFDELRESIR